MRYAILGREKYRPWTAADLLYLTDSVERAWRLAHAIEEQEHLLAENEKYDSKVMTESDFDEGKFAARVKPPEDFDLALPVGNADDATAAPTDPVEALKAKFLKLHGLEMPKPAPPPPPVQVDPAAALKAKFLEQARLLESLLK